MAQETEPQLLARALEGLQPDERQRVTAWLLDRSPRPAGRAAKGAVAEEQNRLLDSLHTTDLALRRVYATRAFADRSLREVLGQQLASAGTLSGEHQVVPVRLPAELHGRLRGWCSGHGFTMATVVRGLVAKFLESQPEPEPAAPEP